MRALFLCHSLGIGGLETYLLRFSGWALEQDFGLDIHVLCKSGIYGAYEKEFTRLGVTLHALPLGYLNPLPYVRLYHLLQRNAFDAVCDFSDDFSGITAAIGKLAVVSTRVSFYRSSRPPFRHSLAKYWYQRAMNFLVCVCSTHILSNSQEAFRYFFEKRGKKVDHRFMVIPNGIPLASPLSSSDRARLLEDVGWQHGQKIVLHVGSGRWEKNHGCILDIAKFAQSEKLDTLFLLVGPGVEDVWGTRAAELALNNLRFLGARRDVDQLLQVADVFIFPSLSEGQPNALLESLVNGVPFIASDIVQIRETLPPGWGGRWLFPTQIPALGYVLLKEHLEGNSKQDLQFRDLVTWSRSFYNQDRCFKKFLDVLTGTSGKKLNSLMGDS